MTAAERGVLLLCCALGDPGAHPMTMAQFRELSQRASALGIGAADPLAEVGCADLQRLGYSPAAAARIAALLGREDALARYLARAERLGMFPLTRLSGDYPAALAQKRGMSCPPVFFCAGSRELLKKPCVALAGSRKLGASGAAFARRAGALAAAEGFVLVTGGAEGADSEALEACLQNGGSAIVFLPDALQSRIARAGARCLLCSENGYDLQFTPARALTRNTYIHMMGSKTLIAQVGNGVGGTWSGAAENLRNGWSPLFVSEDGSPGAAALIERGATPVRELKSLRALQPAQIRLFESIHL